MVSFFLTLSNKANANIVSSVDCFENLTTIANLNETETICYSIEYYDFKDGKWKARWREFAIGFLEEISKPIAPPNDNDNDFSEEDLKAIQTFAKEKIGNKEEALNLFYKMDMLIHSENQYINEGELLEVFKRDNSMRDLLNKIFHKRTKNISNKKSNARNRNVKNLKMAKKAEVKLSKKAMKFNGNGKIVIDKDRPGIFRELGRLVAIIVKHFL